MMTTPTYTRRFVSRAAWLMLLTLLTTAGSITVPQASAAIAPPELAVTPLAAVAPSAALAPLNVVVSIPPLRGLIEPLLPPGSRVEVLIPPGVSEHGFEIPPAALAAVVKADLVVQVGLGLEPRLEKFLRSSPAPARVVVVFAQVMGHASDGGDHATHSHDKDGNCIVSPGSDPHLWLDPIAAKSLVREVSSRIIELRPLAGVELRDHPTRKAARAQMAALDQLDAEYKGVVARASTRMLVVGHDAYRLLAARYGLETVAIAGLSAGEPKPADLARAIAAVRDNKLPAVFIEPQISPRAAQRVAEATGAKVLTLDPLGAGDYFATMRQNLAAIAQGLGVRADDAGGGSSGGGSGGAGGVPERR